eukprot:c53735_g1_i1.p1 GENE.c53735_g1_i1~~c53735_g1_i1.p1  ORF type:complete len:431 (+),score=39.74 c53735_g1_i1:128-1294(+)
MSTLESRLTALADPTRRLAAREARQTVRATQVQPRSPRTGAVSTPKSKLIDGNGPGTPGTPAPVVIPALCLLSPSTTVAAAQDSPSTRLPKRHSPRGIPLSVDSPRVTPRRAFSSTNAGVTARTASAQAPTPKRINASPRSYSPRAVSPRLVSPRTQSPSSPRVVGQLPFQNRRASLESPRVARAQSPRGATAAVKFTPTRQHASVSIPSFTTAAPTSTATIGFPTPRAHAQVATKQLTPRSPRPTQTTLGRTHSEGIRKPPTGIQKLPQSEPSIELPLSKSDPPPLQVPTVSVSSASDPRFLTSGRPKEEALEALLAGRRPPRARVLIPDQPPLSPSHLSVEEAAPRRVVSHDDIKRDLRELGDPVLWFQEMYQKMDDMAKHLHTNQ